MGGFVVDEPNPKIAFFICIHTSKYFKYFVCSEQNCCFLLGSLVYDLDVSLSHS